MIILFTSHRLQDAVDVKLALLRGLEKEAQEG